MTFIVREAIPVFEIAGEVDLLGSPERCLGLFVHGSDVCFLGWQEDESTRGFSEQGFLEMTAIEFGLFVFRNDNFCGATVVFAAAAVVEFVLEVLSRKAEWN